MGLMYKYSYSRIGHGIEFFAAIVRHRLEGMMAKRIDSPYLIGKRSSDWLKIKAASFLVSLHRRLLCENLKVTAVRNGSSAR